MSYVFYHGIKDTTACFYNRGILVGLTFSLAGDILLVWQDTSELFFLGGMGAFGLGLLAYTVSFGFRPFGVKELVLALFVHGILCAMLLPCLHGFMRVAVMVYSLLLMILAWRAMARFTLKDLDIPWRKMYACAGAVLFVASDFVLAYDKFCGGVMFEHEIVMTTYYAAQGCIALSIINHNLLISHEQRNKND